VRDRVGRREACRFEDGLWGLPDGGRTASRVLIVLRLGLETEAIGTPSLGVGGVGVLRAKGMGFRQGPAAVISVGEDEFTVGGVAGDLEGGRRRGGLEAEE